jgi:endonuclease/exonuclease/phosphatase family metal-dependent hydrolase
MIRVLSYNIHKGFTPGNRRLVLSRIRDAIRDVHADLVFLQEVLGTHDDHAREPQFEYLADRLWPHYAYGKNAVYTSGHHGNAILSKYPFTAWENVDVSTNRLERRGLLHGVIEIPHRRKPLHAICVHLGLLEAERYSQIESLCRRVREMVPDDEPVIVGGDFNDWRTRLSHPLRRNLGMSEAFEDLHGSAARTFPSWLPALRLDRIYFRGMRAREAQCLSASPWNRLSDHVALYAEMGF